MRLRLIALVLLSTLIACSHPQLNLAVQLQEGVLEVSIANRTDKTLVYTDSLLDHPLDAAVMRRADNRSPRVTGFLLVALDSKGGAHLRCGTKDFGPPGPAIRLLSLSPGEVVTFPVETKPASYGCRTRETQLRMQVLYITATGSEWNNLSKRTDYQVLASSNSIPWPEREY